MARPTKEGLEYISIDLNIFDDVKILFVQDRFGEKGELIAIKLLLWVYENGYYREWNDEIALLFAKKKFANCSFNLVNEVVNELIKRGFFNEAIFNEFGILTSKGIQKRWLDVIVNSKRKCELKAEFNLLIPKIQEETPPKREETPSQGEETPSQREETTQSKVKESKVKESKVEKGGNSENDSHPIFESNLFQKPNIPQREEVQMYFRQNGGTIEMANKFFDSNNAVGWYFKSSPIKNFRFLVSGYIETWKRNEQQKSELQKQSVRIVV